MTPAICDGDQEQLGSTMARRRFSLKIVDDTLKKVFFKLGVAIGTTPGYFIIVPLLLTVTN